MQCAALLVVIGLVLGSCTGSPEEVSDSTTPTTGVDPSTTTTPTATTADTLDGFVPPIYQSVEDILALLNASSYCSNVEVYPVEDLLDFGQLAHGGGIVGMAMCDDGRPRPELSEYAVAVFDSESVRRLFLLGLAGWGCMEALTFPYAYGPNWLLVPDNDGTGFEAVDEAAQVVSGIATAADCRGVYDTPDDLDPENLDLVWYRGVTGELEFPPLADALFPEAPQVPPATGIGTFPPNDGVIADGLFVAVGDFTGMVWQLPDPADVEITWIDYQFRRIVAIPDGFVTVGSNPASALSAYSADGKQWETTELNGGEIALASSVAIGPVGLVAVGGDKTFGPIAWVSDDGRVWQRYDPDDIDGTPLEGEIDSDDRVRRLEHVAANQQGYVVVNSAGEQSRAWFTEDLITWSEGYDFEGSVQDLVVHQDRFILIVENDDNQAGIWWSDDGSTWSEAVRPGDLGLSHPGLNKRALASTPAGVLAITVNGAIVVSPDGIDWTPVEAPEGLDNVSLPTVIGGPDGWYLIGNIGSDDTWAIFYSGDGTNWDRVGSE